MEKKKLGTGWKVLIAVGCVVLVLLLVSLGAVIWMTNGLSKYKKMTIADIDLSKVEDGTYEGRFSGGRWSNTLEVTVKDHRITRIELEKDMKTSSKDTSRKLFDSVIDGQTTLVDTVSGATVTSKAYLKAIENALSGKQ